MQTEPRPQFRVNLPVVITTAVAAFAMALPVATLMLAFQPPRKPAPAQDVTPLRDALVRISENELGAGRLETEKIPLALSAGDVGSERGRIEELASRFDASVVVLEENSDLARLLVNVSARSASAFVQACGVDAPVPGGMDAGPVLVEIQIRKK